MISLRSRGAFTRPMSNVLRHYRVAKFASRANSQRLNGCLSAIRSRKIITNGVIVVLPPDRFLLDLLTVGIIT